MLRACDIGQLPQHVLVSLANLEPNEHKRMCVFADVVQHCAPQAVSWLRAAAPGEDCSADEAKKAYSTILKWLLANRSWVFPLDGKQECLVHKQQCPVCPLAAWSARVKHLQERSTAFKSQKRKFQAVADSLPEGSAAAQVQEGQDSLASGSASSVSVGPGESDECDNACDLEGERPLSVCFAGVTCDGWSSMGLQKRYSHDSELPHSVWVAERIARAQQSVEDLAFVEFTSKYPAEDKLSAPMSGTHRVLHLKVDPQAFGFPVSRPRMFAACLNLETIVWAGPENWKDDFADKFQTPCALSGDVLFLATPEQRACHYKEMAKQQRNFKASQKAWEELSDQELLASTLSPGQQQRAQKYLAARERMEGPNGSYLFDVEHHLEARNMGGPLWPCLLTHGCVVSAPRRGRLRIATPAEHLGAQGLHVLPAACEDNAQSPLAPILLKLKGHQMKQLSGRGVHVAVLAAWMTYILSNIVPKSKTMPICRLGT